MTLEELEKIVTDYMDSFNTMTLSCPNGAEPWSAPVYYSRQGFDLIFFSSSKSLHSETLELNPRAAVSIFGQYDRWQDIKGLQISGLKNVASLGIATRTYLKRYPFAADFFSNTGFIVDVLARRTRILSPLSIQRQFTILKIQKGLVSAGKSIFRMDVLGVFL
jgi:uncharacterized protein YhbP (UPF0306 family)